MGTPRFYRPAGAPPTSGTPRFYRPGPRVATPPPEEEPGIGRKALDVAQGALNVAGAGAGAVAGGINALLGDDAYMRALTENLAARDETAEDVAGSGIFRALRAAPGAGQVIGEAIADEPTTAAGRIGKRVGSLVGDIVLDPLTFATGGLAAAGAAAKAGKPVLAASRVLGSAPAGLVYAPEIVKGATEAGGTAIERLRAGDIEGALEPGVEALLMTGLGGLMARGVADEVRGRPQAAAETTPELRDLPMETDADLMARVLAPQVPAEAPTRTREELDADLAALDELAAQGRPPTRGAIPEEPLAPSAILTPEQATRGPAGAILLPEGVERPVPPVPADPFRGRVEIPEGPAAEQARIEAILDRAALEDYGGTPTPAPRLAPPPQPARRDPLAGWDVRRRAERVEDLQPPTFQEWLGDRGVIDDPNHMKGLRDEYMRQYPMAETDQFRPGARRAEEAPTAAPTPTPREAPVDRAAIEREAAADLRRIVPENEVDRSLLGVADHLEQKITTTDKRLGVRSRKDEVGLAGMTEPPAKLAEAIREDGDNPVYLDAKRRHWEHLAEEREGRPPTERGQPEIVDDRRSDSVVDRRAEDVPVPTEQRSGQDRRALPAEDASFAPEEAPQRRAADRPFDAATVAREVNLPEDHPAVQRLVEARRESAETRQQADVDELTGVGSRNAYQRALREEPPPAAVSEFDLQGGGATNQKFGERYTDARLSAMGQALQHAVGKRGKVYRKGGDEFVVHWADAAEGQQAHPEVARALQEAEVVVYGADGSIETAWKGVDHYDGHGSTFDEASAAVYAKKPREGDPRYKQFAPDLPERIAAGRPQGGSLPARDAGVRGSEGPPGEPSRVAPPATGRKPWRDPHPERQWRGILPDSGKPAHPRGTVPADAASLIDKQVELTREAGGSPLFTRGANTLIAESRGKKPAQPDAPSAPTGKPWQESFRVLRTSISDPTEYRIVDATTGEHLSRNFPDRASAEAEARAQWERERTPLSEFDPAEARERPDWMLADEQRAQPPRVETAGERTRDLVGRQAEAARQAGAEDFPLFSREANDLIEGRRPKRAAGGKKYSVGSDMRAAAFYSALERAAEGKLPKGRMTPSQVLASLKNVQGVKADEIKWTGLDEWLTQKASAKEPVTREDVLAFLKQNRVEVKEITLGGEGSKEAKASFEEANERAGDAQEKLMVALAAALRAEQSPEARAAGFRTNGEASSLSAGVARGETVAMDRASDLLGSKETQHPLVLATYNAWSRSNALRNAMEDAKTTTKFGQYTLPGGENYRELLLTMPQLPSPAAPVRWQMLDKDGVGVGSGMGHTAEEAMAEFRRIAPKRQVTSAVLMPKEAGGGPEHRPGFRSSHFDEPNILAHVRFNERTDADGKRVLFVEEIQSDWAQKGRREGFALDPNETAPMDAEYRRLVHKNADARREGREPDPADIARAQELEAALDRSDKSKTPQAPFVDKTEGWLGLAGKRMLRWAAENDFDRVAWTKGGEQFRRWGSERFDWKRRGDGAWDVYGTKQSGGEAGGFNLEAEARARNLSSEGRQVITSQEDLAEFVRARMEHPEDAPKVASRMWERMQTEAEGTSMPRKEGMEGFYDQILPSWMNKYGKKWGARVGETTLPESGGRNQIPGIKSPSPRHPAVAVHSLDITPSMKKSVLEEGQPLFSAGRKPSDSAVTTEHLRKAFPSGKVRELADGQWMVELAGNRRIGVDLVGEIVYQPEAFRAGRGRAMESDERILGSWERIDRDGLIQLAKQGGDEATLRHETFHAAMDLALSAKERAAVLKHYGSEEAAADAYAKWSPRERSHSIFQRILDVFRNLYRSLRPSAESTFGDVYSGKAFKRGGKTLPGASGPDYATRAFHGSRHDFDRFDMEKIGTGEGSQYFGHGLYFASNQDVAEFYRKMTSPADQPRKVRINGISENSIYNGAYPLRGELTEAELRQALGHITYYARLYRDPEVGLAEARRVAETIDTPEAQVARRLFEAATVEVTPDVRGGKMYEVELAPDEADYLDWDKPLSEQSEKVRNALGRLGSMELPRNASAVRDALQPFEADATTGATIVRLLGKDEMASRLLKEAGIPGIRYLDKLSREAGEGTSNYVIFDDSLITTKAKYAVGRKPAPGQRGFEDFGEDVAQAREKPREPEQRSMFGGEMLQGVERNVPEGREAEGPLFREEAPRPKEQGTLPKYSSGRVPPKKGPGDRAAEPTDTPGGGKIDADSLSREVLSRMGQRLKAKGYDLRGADDVRDLLKRRMIDEDGQIWQDDWREAYEAATGSRAKRQATAKTLKDQTPHVDWETVRKLPTTTDPKKAGYIRPDGALLDMSYGDRARVEDHRIVGGVAGMQELGNAGYIRWMPEGNGLDLYREPTAQQYKQIRDVTARAKGEVILDLQDGLGEIKDAGGPTTRYGDSTRKAYLEFPEGTNPERIVGMIRRFYSGEDVGSGPKYSVAPAREPGKIKPIPEGKQAEPPTLENKPSLSSKAYEVWINGLLSGPKTHLANFVGNSLTQLLRIPEKAIAGALSKERFVGEAAADLASVREGVRKAVHIFRDRVGKESFDAESKVEHGPKIEGKAGEIVRLPTRLLGATDEAFKAIASTREAHSLAFRKARLEGKSGKALSDRVAEIVSDLGLPEHNDIVERMLKEADYQTFTKKLGDFGQRLTALRDSSGPLKVIAPFLRTPINISKYTLERTPLNFARIATKYAQGKLRGGELADELAKPLLGTFIGMGLALAASEGFLTGGGPGDEKKRALKRDTGWQPYSVKLGKDYYSFQRFEPFSSIAGFAADMVEAKNEHEEKDLVNKIVGSVAENLTNKTFLQGVENVFLLWSDPQRYASQYAKNLQGSIVPTLVANLAQAIDPNVRETDALSGSAIAARVPGASMLLKARHKPTGEPMERESRVFNAIVPAAHSREKGKEADLEREFLAADYTPARPGRALTNPYRKGSKVDLTDDEYTLFREQDERATARLRRIIRAPGWRSLSPEKKKEQMVKLYGEAHRTARSKVYRSAAFRKRAQETLRERA